MTTIGTFEAKTHLTRLLARVECGERILITRRGKPVAMLISPPESAQPDVRQVVSEMLAQRDRSGPRLGKGVSLRALREEGRRF
ncbi:MAG: type II toxin-antitoxin system Phd/YefM family antitoxin [Planctomycetaceae bacterium]